MPALSQDYPAVRRQAQCVAAHVLARARFQAVGKFGLRAQPGGFGTPVFGPMLRTLRVDTTHLIVEDTGTDATSTSAVRLDGSTLNQLAEFVGADLDAGFDAGADLPALPDRDMPLELPPTDVAVVADWFDLGWRVLTQATLDVAGPRQSGVLQLWPEHFDAGIDVTTPAGAQATIGFSPGDAGIESPYIYVSAWRSDGLADEYWNAPFGAALEWADVVATPDAPDRDPTEVAYGFVTRGLRYLDERESRGE